MLFICQDADHLDLFLDAADRELTGYQWQPNAPNRHIGRQRLLFADEAAIHRGEAVAYRVPTLPPRDRRRVDEDASVRGAKLPGFHSRAAA